MHQSLEYYSDQRFRDVTPVVIPTDFYDCQAQLVSCLKENEGVQGQLRQLLNTLPSQDALDQQASKHKEQLKQVQMNAFALVESAEECVVRTEKFAQSKIRDVGLPRADVIFVIVRSN